MIELAADRYGKAAIRIVRVGREATPHDLRDLTVAIALEGDFVAAHTDGDNSLRRRHRHDEEHRLRLRRGAPAGSIEQYATALARHFLDVDQVERATVNVREHAWRPIDVAGTPAPDAFVRGGEGTRVATVAATADGVRRRGRRRGPRRHEDDAIGVHAASRATGSRPSPRRTTG